MKTPEQESDQSAIRYNLSLNVEQRLEQHEDCLRTVEELEKARKELYEKPQTAS